MRYHEIAEHASRPPRKPSGTVKPLSPSQARARADKRAEVNRQITDTQAASGRKVQALRAKLARTP